MNKLMMLLMLLISGQAYATEWRLLDLDRVSIEYARIEDYRDFFYTEDRDQLEHRGQFDIDVRMLQYGYLRNQINLLGTKQQVRGGGWEFEGGVQPSKYIDLFYHHLSQHVFERERQDASYPLRNYYGIRLIFYDKGWK